MRFLISTLAEYQTGFWRSVGIELQRLGHEVAFISFDDRSSEMLEAAGLTTFAAAEHGLTAEECDAAIEKFGITDVNFWLTHERFAFGIRDGRTLRGKLARALLVADRACREWQGEEKPILIQELGGFLSVIGCYFAARAHGIDNWFVEPSFFRGRLFFLKNRFSAIQVNPGAGDITPEIDRYLDETIARGAIVVPLKDQHQYTTAWKKVVNSRNLNRLIEKLSDKYLKNKSQEFSYIGAHVANHLRMVFNSFTLKRKYTPLAECGKFVYYPLHVPGDMALTLRSPTYLDQLALIDFLCRSVPATHQVVIKEHPAMIGAVGARRLAALLRRYDNLFILPPSTNNYLVLHAASLVISVNSKTGAEAGLLAKPVIVLGDAFYRSAPFAVPVDDIRALPSCIGNTLGKTIPLEAETRRFFADVWQQSFPGELYIDTRENVARFSSSILEAVG